MLTEKFDHLHATQKLLSQFRSLISELARLASNFEHRLHSQDLDRSTDKHETDTNKCRWTDLHNQDGNNDRELYTEKSVSTASLALDDLNSQRSPGHV